jgi:DNA-binding IclR family transcriptional regulator
VPIVDPTGAPLAGLSISAPAARLDAGRKAQFASTLRRIAGEISHGLDAPRPKMMTMLRRQA